MRDASRELIAFVTRSDNRATVLAALATGDSFTSAELQTATGKPRAAVRRVLDDCLDRRLLTCVNDRYEPTPFGVGLAARLRSIFDSIDAMQRFDMLVTQLSDADPDATFTDHPSSEMVTLTAADPGAPTRRFADRLRAASHVRLLVPSPMPELLHRDSALGRECHTVDIVVARKLLEAEWDTLRPSRQHRGVLGSREVTVFSYDGDVPHFIGTIDGIAIIGLFDDAGLMQAYLETDDGRVRSRTEATIETYIQRSDCVTSPISTDCNRPRRHGESSARTVSRNK